MKVNELIKALGQYPGDFNVVCHLEPNAEDHMGSPSVSESLDHVSEFRGEVYIKGVALPCLMNRFI